MGKWRKRYKQGQQQQSFNRLHRAVEVDHERLMHEAVEAERAKVEQLDFLQRMKALKTSILARTLFVDHVNVDELPAIRDFFQTNFGPVEDCLVATKQQPKHVTRIQAAPLAASSVRVRFQSERDADRVFKDLNRLIIPPRYMRHELHRRITVSRSYDYDGVLKHIEEATEIEIVAYSWALGHYFPQDDGRPDYVSDINRLIEQGRSQRSSSSSTRTEEWLEEVSIEEETPSSSAIKVRIDMVKRMITLEFSATDYAELRFKELSRPIEICQDCHSTSPQTRRYSLIVSWKHPPKLYSRALMSFGPIQLVDTGREASRNVSCASLPSSAFGDCFALKLEVEDTSLLGLFLNFNGLATLRSFGIVRQTVNTMEDATTITAKNIGTRTDQVAKAFEMLHREDRTVGMPREHS